jgi:GT2 family glycosyltransferase
MAETRRRDARREEPVETVPVPREVVEETIQPRVSVILIGYNQAPALRRAIEALERSKDREHLEILLVDSGSSDESSQLDVDYPGISMLRLPHHFGATKALNIATRTAKAEIVLFLSPNVEVTPDTVMQIADKLEADNDTSAAGPVLFDPEGHPVSKNRKMPSPRSLDGEERPIDLKAESVAVEYAGLDALMIRKQFIKGMNYFDEGRFGNSWADADLAMKILQAQRKIRLFPAIQATWHDEPDPLIDDPLYSADRTLGASAFFGKYYGFMAGLTFRLGAIFRALGRFNFRELSALISGQKLDGSQAM